MEQEKPKKRKLSLMKGMTYAFLGSLLFISGLGIGSGRISLANPAVFNIDQENPTEQSTKLPDDLDYATVERVYDALRTSYDGELTVEQLMDGLKAGLATATGDPFTEFLNQEAATDFNEQLTGEFTGIGAELSKDEDDNVIVVAPISGFPAEKAGLRAKDIITDVDGESTRGQTLSEVVNRIRGEEGTKVKLTVVRNRAEQLDIEITRAKIKIPSVTYEIQEGNIGYLRISRYGEDTVTLTHEAANEFKKANVKGVVLDLRNDPGGLLDAAVGVSSLWLEPGDVVLREKRGGVVIRTFNASGSNPLKGVPTVVLVNEGSASASEITAGALRDNKAARLIGTTTFGKGSVQKLETFRDGSVLKVTIARWFTPNDVNIDEDGLKPDQEVEITEEDVSAKRDPQLEAAKKSLR